jgi:GxxExxY protein
MSENEISRHIVDAALKVHKALGPGLLESSYRACLAHGLRRRGLRVQEEVPLPIEYEGIRIEVGYRLDLLVEGLVVTELKTVRRIVPIHEAQLLSHLKLGRYRLGLLINFHVKLLRDGIRRFAN